MSEMENYSSACVSVCVCLFYLISTSNYTRVAASCSSADSQVQQYNVYNETFTNQTLNKTPTLMMMKMIMIILHLYYKYSF